MNYIESVYAWMSAFMLIFLSLLMLLAVILFVIDIMQSGNAVRRNYPLIGRFRSLFEHMGTFFRHGSERDAL